MEVKESKTASRYYESRKKLLMWIRSIESVVADEIFATGFLSGCFSTTILLAIWLL